MNNEKFTSIITNAVVHNAPIRVSEKDALAKKLDTNPVLYTTKVKDKTVKWHVINGRQLKVQFMTLPWTKTSINAIANVSQHDYNIAKVSMNSIVDLINNMDLSDKNDENIQEVVEVHISRIMSALNHVDKLRDHKKPEPDTDYIRQILRGVRAPQIPLTNLFGYPEVPSMDTLIKPFTYVDDTAKDKETVHE